MSPILFVEDILSEGVRRGVVEINFEGLVNS